MTTLSTALVLLVALITAMAIGLVIAVARSVRLRERLITRLGGQMAHSTRECAETFWLSLRPDIRGAVIRSCQKVARDPGIGSYPGSNLGREIRRDEAVEWAKLYLKDEGAGWRDSDVHLACELYYFLYMRRG